MERQPWNSSASLLPTGLRSLEATEKVNGVSELTTSGESALTGKTGTPITLKLLTTTEGEKLCENGVGS